MRNFPDIFTPFFRKLARAVGETQAMSSADGWPGAGKLEA
jgi:hypothetical protein